MFNLLIYLYLTSMATDVAIARFMNIPVVPEGFSLHNVLATWQEADYHCKSEGAILASPNNQETYYAINTLISAVNSTFHTGARVSENSGKFVSLEGVPLDDMFSATWQVLDPWQGDCLAMNTVGIRAVPCETRLPYICYRPNEIDNKTMGEVGWQGYIYNNKTANFYKIHNASTWQSALKICANEGAHLAVINNEYEAMVIKNMTEFNTMWMFIGLRQVAKPGDWRSVHGEPVEALYNKWAIGYKPAVALYCGAIKKTGVLDDILCGAALPFICEKKPSYSQV